MTRARRTSWSQMKILCLFFLGLGSLGIAACGAPFEASPFTVDGQAGVTDSMGGSGSSAGATIGLGHAGHAGSSAVGEAGQGGSGSQGEAGAGGAPAENGGAAGSMTTAGMPNLGSGGTSAVGGTAASGGSTTGGFTGSGGSVSGNGISVQYKAVTVTPAGQYIQCELYVVNAGPHVYNVSDLRVRYYYTSEIKSPEWSLNWSHITTSGSNQLVTVTESIQRLIPAAPGADTYLEFSFDSPAQPTLGTGEGIGFGWRLNANPVSPLVQSNDYSFDPSKTEQADWSHVVLLHGGTVIWGTTP